MTVWVHVCSLAEAPDSGKLLEVEAQGRAICLANIGGRLAAIDNVCPHRQGPMAEGWIEGNAVVCPWHSWAFDAASGLADYPEGQRVEVFPVKVEQDGVLVAVNILPETDGESTPAT